MANVPIVTEVTYAQLLTLIDDNGLNEGLQYKVTDKGWLLTATGTNTYIFNSSLPYKKWIGSIIPDGIGGIIVHVFENTLGDVIWTNRGLGAYSGTLQGAFLQEKTFIASPFPIMDINGAGGVVFGFLIRGSIDEVSLQVSTPDGVGFDNWTIPAFIEIRVYY